jgi:DNA repair exonuclease SbcCD ATPase subunit
MPKAKQPLSEADSLRAHAGRATGARYEEAIDEVSMLEERKDSAQEAIDALDELDSALDALNTASEAVSGLAEYNLAPSDVADTLANAASLIDDANGEISKDDLQSFVDAYDEAVQALETYSDTKEQDPFPGKRDELESAWGDAQAALEALADALDTIEVTSDSAEEKEGDA